jgi:hypothetical protein
LFFTRIPALLSANIARFLPQIVLQTAKCHRIVYIGHESVQILILLLIFLEREINVTDLLTQRRPRRTPQMETNLKKIALYYMLMPLFGKKSHGFIEKPHGFCPEPHGFTAEPHGFYPKPHGFTAKPHGFCPKPHGFITKPHGFCPKSGGFSLDFQSII